MLLELTTRSSSNRELLFACHQDCKQLFGHVLASCGDFSTQVHCVPGFAALQRLQSSPGLISKQSAGSDNGIMYHASQSLGWYPYRLI